LLFPSRTTLSFFQELSACTKATNDNNDQVYAARDRSSKKPSNSTKQNVCGSERAGEIRHVGTQQAFDAGLSIRLARTGISHSGIVFATVSRHFYHKEKFAVL